MKIKFLIFPLVALLVQNSFARCNDVAEFTKLFDNDLISNYEKLFKVIKCQYCKANKKEFKDEKCKQIKEECKQLLKGGKYPQMVKNLMYGIKVDDSQDLFGHDTEELKKLINFLELHKKEIDNVKGMIDHIKDNKSLLQLNAGNNSTVHTLNAKMKNLKNNVDYIEKSQDFINKHLNAGSDDIDNEDLQNMFNIKETGETDNGYKGLYKLSNSANTLDLNEDDNIHNIELGDIGIKDFVKNNMKDILKNGDGLLDIVKSTLIQDGGNIGGDLVNLIEKGKEIGEKILHIEGVIKGKSKTQTGHDAIEQLDHFKTELASYEYLLVNLKGVVLNKLKDILLKLLYKAYISYRKKKAKELGLEEAVEVTHDTYVNELKKGIIELGMKIFFHKVKHLLSIVKKKIFYKKNSKASTSGKEQKQVDMHNTVETPKLRGTAPDEEVALMSSIDNMIEEIDFYENEMYHNQYVDTANQENANVQGMDEDEQTQDEQMVDEQAANPVVDGTPTDNTPTDNTPTDNTPADNTPTDNTPTDNTPADNTPTDNTPAGGVEQEVEAPNNNQNEETNALNYNFVETLDKLAEEGAVQDAINQIVHDSIAVEAAKIEEVVDNVIEEVSKMEDNLPGNENEADELSQVQTPHSETAVPNHAVGEVTQELAAHNEAAEVVQPSTPYNQVGEVTQTQAVVPQNNADEVVQAVVPHNNEVGEAVQTAVPHNEVGEAVQTAVPHNEVVEVV
ncbi:merozoite surface protein 9 (MSP9) [Plasmodium malariae]|uniref:Merozoite surface protein 9 (MSP9) n=1 Tax=Plasmodium malariae TaxID=5858 RepID=A0A1A8WGT3_PLAMA|nr:merozoite surface protein 9 (MSP9) [Plasmodium malariae]